VRTVSGALTTVDNPAHLPEREQHRGDRGAVHPHILSTLPEEYLGGRDEAVRGSPRLQRDLRYLGEKRVILHYELPLPR